MLKSLYAHRSVGVGIVVFEIAKLVLQKKDF